MSISLYGCTISHISCDFNRYHMFCVILDACTKLEV
nr:MAG TPA: hypothetical protein [Caudoviricetes sp.]